MSDQNENMRKDIFEPPEGSPAATRVAELVRGQKGMKLEDDLKDPNLLIVQFAPTRDGVKGITLAGASKGKGIRIDRNYRGRIPTRNEVWVCNIAGETPHTIFVCPQRIPTYEVFLTNNIVLGVREAVASCLENRDFGKRFNSNTPNDVKQKADEANTSYREAKDIDTHLRTGRFNRKFVDMFGEPKSIVGSSENSGEVILDYGKFTKKTLRSDVMETLASTEIGPLYENGSEIFGTFALIKFPDLTGRKIVGGFGSYPRKFPAFAQLSSDSQKTVLEKLKSAVKAPSALAQEILERKTEKHNIAIMRADTILILGATKEIKYVTGTHQVDEYYDTYVDGYQVYYNSYNTMKVTRSFRKLFADTLPVNSHYSIDGTTLEEKKASYLAEVLQKVRDEVAFNSQLDGGNCDPEIFGMTQEEYNTELEQRYNEQLEVWLKVFRGEVEKEGRVQLGKNQIIDAEDAFVAQQSKDICGEIDQLFQEHQRLLETLKVLNFQLYWEKQTENCPATRGKTIEDLKTELQVTREWVDQLAQLVKAEAERKNQLVLEAQISAQDEERTLADLMNGPSEPAPWFIVEPNTYSTPIRERFEAMAAKFGRGVSSKIAGKHLLLPGKKGVVGIEVSPGTKKYQAEILKIHGVSPVTGHDFPTHVSGRSSAEILGIIEDQEGWFVSYVVNYQGLPHCYYLYNRDGYIQSYPGASHTRKDWSGNADAGPTIKDIETIFGISLASTENQYEYVGNTYEPQPQPPAQKAQELPKPDVPQIPAVPVTVDILAAFKAKMMADKGKPQGKKGK